MLTLAAPLMSTEKQDVCTYTGTKIDDAVLPLARAAAALSGDITVQEFISEAVNQVASKVLNRKPIKRRPAPTKPHSPGRPKGS